MGAYFYDASQSLVQILFDFYTLLLMLRFLLQCARADLHRPPGTFLLILTNPPLRVLRTLIPNYGVFDLPALLLMFLLQGLKLLVLVLLAGQTTLPPLAGLALLAGASLLRLAIHVYMFCILLQALISWIIPYAHSPPLELMRTLTAPLLSRCQRLLPPIGGLDLSPMVALLALYLMLMLVQAPLHDLGLELLRS